MGDRKRKFSHAEELDRDATLALLEGLVDGLRRGELRLEHNEHGLILRPEGAFEVRLEARHKPERESFELSLAWTPAASEPVLRIGAAGQTRAVAAAGADDERGADKHELIIDAAAPDELFEVDEAALAELPRARLYELAKAVELDGRSQLPKRALARALCDCDIWPLLRADERAQVRSR